jgi:hypothetical protein
VDDVSSPSFKCNNSTGSFVLSLNMQSFKSKESKAAEVAKFLFSGVASQFTTTRYRGFEINILWVSVVTYFKMVTGWVNARWNNEFESPPRHLCTFFLNVSLRVQQWDHVP